MGVAKVLVAFIFLSSPAYAENIIPCVTLEKKPRFLPEKYGEDYFKPMFCVAYEPKYKTSANIINRNNPSLTEFNFTIPFIGEGVRQSRARKR